MHGSGCDLAWSLVLVVTLKIAKLATPVFKVPVAKVFSTGKTRIIGLPYAEESVMIC